jgi:dephospho-CoA kinase
MLRIGLTGGIGSGKSTVALVFNTLGIPVYNADDAARKLMNENAELREQIVQHFGETSYADGKLDRKYLALTVFNDPEKLRLLNSLVHPLSLQDSQVWMLKQKSPYALKEAALIFESGAEQFLDYVIGVSAPEEIRIKRVIERDKVSRERVLERIEKQMDEDQKINRCDFVIFNDDKQMILPQIFRLHQEILELGGQTKKLQ